jgi:hypothetical protein
MHEDKEDAKHTDPSNPNLEQKPGYECDNEPAKNINEE